MVLSALLIVGGYAKAQQTAFADSSAQWIYITYTVDWPFSPTEIDNRASRFFIWGDTLIEDVSFAKVYVNTQVFGLTPSLSSAHLRALMREDSGRVWLRVLEDPYELAGIHESIEEFGDILMFDFNVGVGDTIFHGSRTNPFNQEIDSVYSVVTGTDSIFEEGAWYRAYNADEFISRTYPSGQWTQNMDGLYHDLKREPFGSEHNGLFGPFMAYAGLNQVSWLSCFHSEGYQYSSETWATCLNVSVPDNDPKAECISLTSDRIGINCGNSLAEIKVVNMMGQVVKRNVAKDGEWVNLSELPRGVYAVSVSVAEQTWHRKVYLGE
jgi:hypothetical protein